jgi:taurine dioxygenase
MSLSATLERQAAEPLGIHPLTPVFGAEITGLRIGGDVDDATMAAVMAALHRHGVLLVRGVPRDDAAQVAFSRRMGPLEIHASPFTLADHPEVFCVGNYEENGVPKANFATGVEQWHADSSFRAVPSAASLFYGALCPPEGGETWFLDSATAYEELPAALKARIEGLVGVHDLATLSAWNQRHTPGRPGISEETRRRFPPMPQPLVQPHPVTGRRSLFIAPAVISHIEGMTPAASAALIEEIMQHAAQERYIYRHRWTAGDLVIWDNRATLHTATLFDHTKYVRLMLRTTVAGSA